MKPRGLRPSRDMRRECRFDYAKAGGLGTEVSGPFSKVGIESDIPEVRGHKIKRVKVREMDTCVPL
jgi:hypothetical protein